MKRRVTIAAATLFATSTLAVPALAASIGVDVGANVGGGVQAGAGSSGVQIDAGANIGGNAGIGSDPGSAGFDSGATASTTADFNTIVSSIGDESSAAAIRTMTEVGAVTVVDVSETAGADESMLGQAVEVNAAQIKEVQASLQANAAVNAALEANKVDVSQVVAANIAADGSLTVYVK